MDPLADVLDLSRVRGALLANVRAHAPWGLELPPSSGASFHAVTAGAGWLCGDGVAGVGLVARGRTGGGAVDAGRSPVASDRGPASARVRPGRPLPTVRPHDEGRP